MPESFEHRSAKRQAAGSSGWTECQTPGGRLDWCRADEAGEVERSGDFRRLKHAAGKLKRSGKRRKILMVPDHHVDLAAEAMREVGVSGTIKNMSGETVRRVRAPNPVMTPQEQRALVRRLLARTRPPRRRSWLSSLFG